MTVRAMAFSVGGTGVFLLLALIAVFNIPVEYDEGYNAAVAKALAQGAGYVTNYSNVVAFNPEITTGPTILLPMAVLIALAGPVIWAPGLATWLVAAPALIGFAVLLAARLEAAGIPSWRAGIAAWPFLLGIWLFGAMGFFSVGMGEAAALALFMLALPLLAAAIDKDSARDAALAGAAIGLAALTKLVMLLPAIGLLGVFALLAWDRLGLRRAAIAAAMAGVALVLPTIVFLLFRAAHFDAAAEAYFMNQAGAGWSVFGQGFRVAGQAIALRSKGNFGILWHWLGGAVGIVLVLASVGLGVRAALRARHGVTSGLPLLVLVGLPAATLVLFAWWLPLGVGLFLRHALPGILLLLLAICLWPSLVPGRGWRLAALAPLVVLGWLGITRAERLDGIPPGYHDRAALGEETIAVTSRLHLSPLPRLAEQREAVAALARIQAENPGRRFLGFTWWVPRDLDYLLPATGNFEDAHRLPSSRIEGGTLVISEAYWNWGLNPDLSAFRDRCPDILFRNRSYVVARCAG